MSQSLVQYFTLQEHLFTGCAIDRQKEMLDRLCDELCFSRYGGGLQVESLPYSLGQDFTPLSNTYGISHPMTKMISLLVPVF
jgi:hypothetical protein